MRPSTSSAPQPPLTWRSMFKVFRSLWPFMWEFRSRVWFALFLLVGAKITTVVMPLALAMIIDNFDGNKTELLLTAFGAVLVYGVLRFATVFLGEMRDAVFSRVTERAMRKIGLKLFKHLHQLDLNFHLSRQTGGIARDIDRGNSGISFLMRFTLFNILPTLIELAMVSALLWVFFDYRFMLVILLSVTIYIGFTVTVTEWRTKYVRQANQIDSKTNTRAIDSLLNYETVKYFNNETFEADNYDENLKNWETARLKNRSSLALLNSGQALISALGLTMMMWLAVTEVKLGTMSIGELVMVNAYMLQIFIPLNFLGFVYREIRRAITDIEQMFELLLKKSSITDDDDAKEIRRVNQSIEFKNVDFGYHENRPIIENFNLSIEAGQKIALVGASGSGKSTIARLLFRFYDVKGGAILMDGIDIKQVKQQSLRATFGVVPQDTVLFNDSIFNNVHYGNPNADEKAVWQAIKWAHLDDFINQLPEKENTVVGERGLKVSGGEKQRIAIARTLLKEPDVFLFDEATSALDSKTEAGIVDVLKSISKDKTTIVIAHRLSTIIDADEIVVIDKGKIVEQGSHLQLLNNKHVYEKLWLQQSQ